MGLVDRDPVCLCLAELRFFPVPQIVSALAVSVSPSLVLSLAARWDRGQVLGRGRPHARGAVWLAALVAVSLVGVACRPGAADPVSKAMAL